MRKPFTHSVGGVLSADIAVPDHERELKFYSTILTTGTAPLWREDLMNNLGSPVIGLGARTPEYDKLPLQWMPHFQVADIAVSVASAIELGGKELMRSPTDEWAVLTDQLGAAFGTIPVVPSEPDSTETNKSIGCISWLTLIVPDALKSQNFYRKVVGWDAKSTNTDNSETKCASFEMLIDSENAAAEICQYRRGHEDIPPVWLIHLPVNDLAESLRRANENGGKVVKELAEPGYAIVRDPVGIYLALQAG